ncbi:hypothetical protein CEP54_001910 [Fusarium duplospermum]|uniref:Uncharacterized protein n=1 Tax=Fusarium duplospermum TaxID=1325734 RepID=A0A428QYA2_9HYPO|nr:hypothetical protein CEP54_001910 [Fusarium duplospermum]
MRGARGAEPRRDRDTHCESPCVCGGAALSVCSIYLMPSGAPSFFAQTCVLAYLSISPPALQSSSTTISQLHSMSEVRFSSLPASDFKGRSSMNYKLHLPTRHPGSS